MDESTLLLLMPNSEEGTLQQMGSHSLLEGSHIVVLSTSLFHLCFRVISGYWWHSQRHTWAAFHWGGWECVGLGGRACRVFSWLPEDTSDPCRGSWIWVSETRNSSMVSSPTLHVMPGEVWLSEQAVCPADYCILQICLGGEPSSQSNHFPDRHCRKWLIADR